MMSRLGRAFTRGPVYRRLQERADPASVDGDRTAGDVARALRGKKSGEGGKLARLAEPAHWNLLFPLGEGVVRRSAGSRTGGARELLDTIGARIAGHEVVHRHLERSDLVGECARESGDSRAKAVGEHESVNRLLDRDRRH